MLRNAATCRWRAYPRVTSRTPEKSAIPMCSICWMRSAMAGGWDASTGRRARQSTGWGGFTRARPAKPRIKNDYRGEKHRVEHRIYRPGDHGEPHVPELAQGRPQGGSL